MMERETSYKGSQDREVIARVHIPFLHAPLPAEDEDTYTRFFRNVRQVMDPLCHFPFMF